MALINEKELIKILKKSKNVLLIEPNYKRQYYPIGLAKISSFIKKNGGKTTYSRGWIPGSFDLICITTLFTTDSHIVIKEIKEIENGFFTSGISIIIGGIFASLMPEYIEKKQKRH